MGASGLHQAAQGCSRPQVLATAWKVLALVLQLLEGLGERERRVETSSLRASRSTVAALSSPLRGGGEGCAEAAGRLGM